MTEPPLHTQLTNCRITRFVHICLIALTAATPRPAAAQAHVHPESPIPDAVGVTPLATPRSRYEIQATRAGQPVGIDGILSDEAWRDAPMIDSFTQQEPNNGQPATERTEVRLLYDSGFLYIGVHAFDSDPDHIVATEMRRDSARLMDEDQFRGDPRHLPRLAIGVHVRDQPARRQAGAADFRRGRRQHARVGVEHQQRLEWRVGSGGTADQRRVDGRNRHPGGHLRSPDVPVQTWGINFMRSIRRKNEQVYWSPIPKPFSIMQVSLAGTVTGMTDLNRGLDLRIKPYVTAGTRYDRLGAVSNTNALKDVGADVRYGLGHGMALDLTVNTDFAQAEVDEQQVNLTRLPCFFPRSAISSSRIPVNSASAPRGWSG